MTLQESLAQKFPFLRLGKEYWDAITARYSKPSSSYSQCGEDLLVENILGERLNQDGIYIEVGGNHPSRFSNTYKFYRDGHSGIIVEPNGFYKSLYNWVRPRDTFIQIGCGNDRKLLEFIHHPRKAYSGFAEGKVNGNFRREHLPVFPLDDLIELLNGKRVFILSIDVEGMDYQVLQGGKNMLRDHVDLVIVEYGDRLDDITRLLTELGFEVKETTTYNLIAARPVL